MKTHRIGAIFVLSIGVTVAAHAQATRTWVSGVGDDVNPCSRTAPCKTFAGAISKTAAGGEIDVLDPGGFGAVTITKSITIDGGGGQNASILASSVNGVIVNWFSCPGCSPPDTAGHIVLRNLRISGGNSGLSGVTLVNAAPAMLTIENCDIYDFTSGANGHGVKIGNSSGTVKVTVANTSIRNISANGIRSVPAGGAFVDLTLDRVRISNAGNAVNLELNTHATITNSVLTFNPSSGLDVRQGTCFANVHNSVISRNLNGIYVGDAGGGVVRLFGTQVTDNSGSGISILAGTVGTAQNNTIQGNAGTQATNQVLGLQ